MSIGSFENKGPVVNFAPPGEGVNGGGVSDAVDAIVQGLTPEQRRENLKTFNWLKVDVSVEADHVCVGRFKIGFIDENDTSRHIYGEEAENADWMTHSDFNVMLRGIGFPNIEEKNRFLEQVIGINPTKIYRVSGPMRRAMVPVVKNNDNLGIMAQGEASGSSRLSYPIIKAVV